MKLKSTPYEAPRIYLVNVRPSRNIEGRIKMPQFNLLHNDKKLGKVFVVGSLTSHSRLHATSGKPPLCHEAS